MKKELLKVLTAEPGKKHEVSEFDSGFTGELKKEDAAPLIEKNVETMALLQEELYAYDRYAALVVFQAMDAAGKDGTIKHVMSGVNPQGCQVFAFKRPSAEELDHGYLWRIQKNVPERGRIGIFNRSHYEDVLVARVHPEIVVNAQIPGIKDLKDVDEKFWEKRYRQINDFERYLSETGTTVIKFFLNVSKDEQRKRLLKRIDDKEKNWKFEAGDLKERAAWDQYMDAYSKMLTKTSTDYAPWYVIPADHKWFMRYAVGQIINHRLEELKMSYPKLDKEAEAGLKACKEQLLNEEKDTKASK
ncbi:MAG: polyphosphate kinase 2 family protein [Prevotella sp.]|nr:polyphosphate kinase 2 family protein [Prevotella sp.]